MKTKKSDRYFFLAFSSYYLFTQIIGFSYSSVNRFQEEGGLPTVAIVHGFFGAVWYLLFFTQTILINKRNVKLHMRLGQISMPVIIAVFLTGIFVIFRLRTPEPIPLMKSEVGLFVLGLVYATLGYIFRKRPHDHKRYYLMSFIMLSPAGVVRCLEFFGYQPSKVIIFLLILFIIPLISILLYDVIAYRKVFRGTLVGIGIYLLNMALGGYLGTFFVDYIRPYFL